MTIHFMQYGMTACQKEGPPRDWPESDHRWSSDWSDVTCITCLNGRELVDTFKLTENGRGITCQRCGYTSCHPDDVARHLCPVCKASHDDLWPPARRWWIEHPDPPEYVERMLIKLEHYPGFRK